MGKDDLEDRLSSHGVMRTTLGVDEGTPFFKGYSIWHGTTDYASQIKQRGRSMMWLGGAIAAVDVFGSLLLGSLGLDVYSMTVRPDVAIGCFAVFFVGFGILMQVWDPTPHKTSIETPYETSIGED